MPTWLDGERRLSCKQVHAGANPVVGSLRTPKVRIARMNPGLPRLIRELTPEERLHLEQQLKAFRNEFACWHDIFTNSWDMLDFAYYDRVTSVPEIRQLLDRTEGLVYGDKCVVLYGCEWCMIGVGGEWHFGVRHETLDEPIDVSQFNRKKLERRLTKAWRRRLFGPPGRQG